MADHTLLEDKFDIPDVHLRHPLLADLQPMPLDHRWHPLRGRRATLQGLLHEQALAQVDAVQQRPLCRFVQYPLAQRLKARPKIRKALQPKTRRPQHHSPAVVGVGAAALCNQKAVVQIDAAVLIGQP